MDVFGLRDKLIQDYTAYTQSFIQIQDSGIQQYVQESVDSGALWPKPLIQLNPSFEPGEKIDDLVRAGVLHPECQHIFQKDKDKPEYHGQGRPLQLHKHQSEAVRVAAGGHNYVLTTGTGSGKSLAYIIPIVDHVLRRGSGRGIQAIVVYPMNALANSQMGELRKFLEMGYADGRAPVTFERYTGQESDEDKNRIMAHPPDILLTNYVMLELILTRPEERQTLVHAAQGLRFLVLDELHTYRGRQGADVAMLVRRVRDALNAPEMQCVGTSATLAGVGSFAEQREKVAEVATLLFGAPVRREDVIGETLRRATPERDMADPGSAAALRARVADETRQPPAGYDDFVSDPLSSWIETTFGVTAELGSQRLIRARPRGIGGEAGAARDLSELTGLPADRCGQAIEAGLLGGYTAEPNPTTGFPAFAFRLHQFISRGDTVYASLEAAEQRHITIYGQQFVPGDRDRVLLPLAFCRECGQEYYTVRAVQSGEGGPRLFLPRELRDLTNTESTGAAGFLYFSATNPWPDTPEAQLELLPEDWLEEKNGALRRKSSHKKKGPEPVWVGPDGREAADGLEMHFVPAPFHFCLRCGVVHGSRQSRSDFAKLSTLGSEGRSTATTILTLSAVRNLKLDESLPRQARKLLSFTDNRQDASLQAGHFNDFVEIAVLRSGLYQAVQAAGATGLTHEELTQKVFDALQLPIEAFAANPSVRFQQRADTDRALRDVLGYRLYHDLRRGWRITAPNLEQCGLLEIEYQSLDEVCAAEDLWERAHPALAAASPATRMKVARTLLDYMRRELCIKVNYLEVQAQERLAQQSNQWLRAPWALDEDEKLEHASVLFPRPSSGDDYGGNVYISGRGGFGQYLRRRSTFEHLHDRLSVADTDTIIQQLLQALAVGPVQQVAEPAGAGEAPGYQLPASALRWRAGDGTHGYHDPIRVPRLPETGARANPFFVTFYRTMAASLRGLEAREHTAQVPASTREERERLFRTATLPILFCSPTMELGVDIAELNVVNMRNVPPTPANYAQRSGRAGRSGQPALVFTYCSVGSPHDQYFFRRPERMVAGAVAPPRLDLANEDLVRAHVQAVWLAETGQGLGTSLKDILNLAQPDLALQEPVQANLADRNAQVRARRRADRILASITSDLQTSGWYSDHWLDDALDQASLRFDQVCGRWRSLYWAALQQRDLQHAIVSDASRSQVDKIQAKRLRQEAESQLELLTEAQNLSQSDFYSYRYFASEGFLPGYSFPRLPLSAYLPGRRQKSERDEFLSRPRFLAISEFGPRAIVYHEGSRYVINRVIMAADARLAPGDDEAVLTNEAKLCGHCGYLHPMTGAAGADNCQRCGMPLQETLRKLFRLQNVATKRRDRISSDEEERFRLGYELRTGMRFTDVGGQPAQRTARVLQGGTELATLTYGQAATLWRINLGWTRRANKARYGFLLDLEQGYWAASDNPDAADVADDPATARQALVIPFVHDRRNCLLFEPAEAWDPVQLASMMAALKSAIQVQYQLEDSELAAEPLPTGDAPRLILLYEAAEGGAGVLHRLVDDPGALASVARRALELCHFDPDTGEDRRHAPGAKEDCEAACYDCLMSYYNQRDHRLLDRQRILPLLRDLATATVSASPVAAPRSDHLQALLNLCDSDLEREWLRLLDEGGYRLPSKAQPLMASCHTRPDFLYEDAMTAIYVDGPQHEFPGRQARDVAQTMCMEDMGYSVLRFGLKDDWEAIVKHNPSVFGQDNS